MKFQTPAALALAARALFPSPNPGDDAEGCAGSGLYMISIRGTNEPPGIGAAGSTVGKLIKDKIGGDSKIVALDYAATFALPSYQDSVAGGRRSLSDLISSHVKACPDDKIAIMGYSQGAHVALDTLCGADEEGFATTNGMDSQHIDNHVVAVTLFGDPTHVANVTYDKGTSIRDGVLSRKNTAACMKYSSMIASWCDTGDIYCDVGQVPSVHMGYIGKYEDNIASFIMDKYSAASNGSSASSSASSATATSSSSGGTVTTTANAAVTTTTTTTTTATDATVTLTGSATPTATPKPNAAGALAATGAGLFVAVLGTLIRILQML